MSSITIYPSNINGSLQAPPSKSCMQRACAAALLKGGTTTIKNYGQSNDDKAALAIIQQLGASVVFEDDKLTIESEFSIRHNQQSIININCVESGLSLRMFTPIAALLSDEILITGEGSLLNRPIDFFDEILPQLNVQTQSNNGKLPLKIKGALQAKNIEVDGSLSSQFLTGLLFAYSSPLSFRRGVGGEATIKVNNLKSKPYIDVTLQVMQSIGLNIPINNNYKEFVFASKPITPLTNQSINYTVEGDWSNTAFLLVAAAIAGSLTIVGLDTNSTQADKAILEALKSCGCNIVFTKNKITINSPLGVRDSFNFDATDCPDLFPPLVVLAAYCKGVSTIKGVSRLQHKESNRANSLQEEFTKMGVAVSIENDTMFIEGATQIKGAIVNSHNDHRIAMACAVAALKANGNMVIENAEAINKSYPNFYEDLKNIGAKIEG